MTSAKMYILAIITIGIAACGTMKKNKTTAPPSGPVVTTSKDGIFTPGNDELTAIQAKHPEVTMETLKAGYTLYTGVCTNCHAAKSIYKRSVNEWPQIIDNMAKEAALTPVQKDAVMKYVLAIKATQPK